MKSICYGSNLDSFVFCGENGLIGRYDVISKQKETHYMLNGDHANTILNIIDNTYAVGTMNNGLYLVRLQFSNKSELKHYF